MSKIGVDIGIKLRIKAKIFFSRVLEGQSNRM
jgi:hypothetical protein